jgi:hypothetical protein
VFLAVHLPRLLLIYLPFLAGQAVPAFVFCSICFIWRIIVLLCVCHVISLMWHNGWCVRLMEGFIDHCSIHIGPFTL